MNIVDSLKKWFYSNNSSAASSDARVPLLNANGTPKGSDTMANIASVLGGQAQIINDMNDAEAGRFFKTGTSSPAHSPVGNKSCWLCGYTYYITDSDFVVQVAYGYDTQCQYIRIKLSGTWGDWHTFQKDLPSYLSSYQNLGSLANALGVAQFRLHPLVNKYFYNAPGQGNTITTECRTKGFIVIQMNGSDDTSTYTGTSHTFTPITEGDAIKLNGGVVYDVGVSERGFITLKQNYDDSYAWNVLIIQISYNGSLASD